MIFHDQPDAAATARLLDRFGHQQLRESNSRHRGRGPPSSNKSAPLTLHQFFSTLLEEKKLVSRPGSTIKLIYFGAHSSNFNGEARLFIRVSSETTNRG
jgi:hypothetical protein